MAKPVVDVTRPKGQRYPGSGRKKGTPNRISVELKTLVTELVNDRDYQHKLRQDFRARRVHPTIEALIWNHTLGKPKETLELTGGLAIDARIAEERADFGALDIADMELLAAETQRLVDRAQALARVRRGLPAPQDVVVEVEPAQLPSESLVKTAESDKGYYVNFPEPLDNTQVSTCSGQGGAKELAPDVRGERARGRSPRA